MSFCVKCGSPLAAGSRFCTNCGTPAATPAPPPAAASGPAPGAGKGSGIGKILLIAGGVVVLLGVLAAAGLFYAARAVKQRVESIAGGGVTAAGAPSRRAADPCALLPLAEAASITGFQLERTEVQGDDCLYFGSAGRAAEQGRAQAEEAMKRLRADDGKGGEEAARVMEDLVKGMAASGGGSGSGYLLKITVKYGEEAQQEESAVRLALGLMGAPQGARGSSVEGVGDRAWLLPMAVGLHMAKGDAYVMIEGPAAPSRDTLIAVARAIAARL